MSSALGSSLAKNVQTKDLLVTGNLSSRGDVSATNITASGDVSVKSVVSSDPNMCIITTTDNQTIPDTSISYTAVTWNSATTVVNNGAYTVSTSGITPTRSGWYEITFHGNITSLANIVAAGGLIMVDGTQVNPVEFGCWDNSGIGNISFPLHGIAYVNAGELISVSVLQDSDSAQALTTRRLTVRAL